MRWRDLLLGPKADLEPEQRTVGAAAPGGSSVPAGSPDDTAALDRYERMLASAPTATIERVHVEAFERLTPAQLDQLFERFTASAATEDDRPADARPASLARSVLRPDARKPGAIARMLGADPAGVALNAWVSASILETLSGFAFASAFWGPWGYGDDGLGGFDF